MKNNLCAFAALLCKVFLAADVGGLALLALSIDGAAFDFARFLVSSLVLTAAAALNWCAAKVLES